jgi:hypothetical protein
MKNLNLKIMTAALALSTSAFAATTRNQLNVNNVVIPSGFDNSDATAFISGLYPNSCYSWDKAEVKDVDATTHEVRSFAKVRGGMCLMVIIPFTEEIHLGRLDAGHHTLRFMNGDGTFLEKTVDVSN